MFLAGSKTVQTSTANLLMYLELYPKVAQTLQNEIDTKLNPIKNDLLNGLTYDLAEEFDYARYCFNETLRIEPPLATSFSQSFS